MSKEYTLEIQRLTEFEGGPLGWYSKGHHDADDFLLGLVDAAVSVVFDPRYLRHEWWRNVPAGPGIKGYLMVKAKPNTRGAYPVTVYE